MSPKAYEMEGFGFNSSGLIVPGGEKDFSQRDREEISGKADTLNKRVEEKRLKEQAEIIAKAKAMGDLVTLDTYSQPISIARTEIPKKLDGNILLDDTETTEAGITLPKGAGRIAKGDSALLVDAKPIHVAKKEEIETLLGEPQARNHRLNASEIAQALHATDLYLERKIANDEKIMGRTRNPLYVFRALGSHGYHPSIQTEITIETESVSRVVTDKVKIINGEEHPQRISEPGGVEILGIELINMLEHDEFKYGAKKQMGMQLNKYRELLNVHRRAEVTLLLPEMPDLTSSIVELLDKKDLDNNARRRLYDILYTMEIATSQKETLLNQMDRERDNGDLMHPLAFRMNLELAQDSPESSWIKAQNERRESMRERLTGTPQNILDNSEELRKLARGIILAEDLDKIKPGKVGMEVEFAEVGRSSEDAVQLEGMPLLPRGWKLKTDTIQLTNLEIVKETSEESLLYGSSYLQDLNELGLYMGQYAQGQSSLHLHFDSRVHRDGIYLGGILTSADYPLGVRQSYRHRTNEVRATLVPGAGYELRVGSIANVISMYNHTSSNVVTSEVNTDLLHLNGTESIEDIALATMARYTNEPTGRLAAIKTLEDPVLFKALNPFALAGSIEPQYRHAFAEKFSRTKLGWYQTDLGKILLEITNTVNPGEVEAKLQDIADIDTDYARSAYTMLKPFWRDLDIDILNESIIGKTPNQIANFNGGFDEKAAKEYREDIPRSTYTWRKREKNLEPANFPDAVNILSWNPKQNAWNMTTYWQREFARRDEEDREYAIGRAHDTLSQEDFESWLDNIDLEEDLLATDLLNRIRAEGDSPTNYNELDELDEIDAS